MSSMARLNQVQPKVYNIGLHDAGSLKPPRSARGLKKTQMHKNIERNSSRRESTINDDEILYENQETSSPGLQSYRDLPTDPPILTSSHQKSAWYAIYYFLIVPLVFVDTLVEKNQ